MTRERSLLRGCPKDYLGRDIEAGIVRTAVQAEGTIGVSPRKEPGAP